MGRRTTSFIGFLVLIISYNVEAKFYPVDLGPFLEKGIPDPYRLSDQEYFRQWLKECTSLFEQVRKLKDVSYNPYSTLILQSGTKANWDYNVNITAENDAATGQASQQSANFVQAVARMAKNFDVSKMVDVQLKGIYKALSELGDANLAPAELAELGSILNRMTTTYSTATICFDPSQTVASLEAASANCPQSLRAPVVPAILGYMAAAWDAPDKRKYAWKAARDAIGKPVRPDFIKYIALKNKASQLTGYADYGQLWRSAYVVDSMNYTDSVFLSDMERLWQQVKPLYLQMHAYIRRKLIENFPNENLSPTAAIPAHLLGDMLSQSWSGMLSFSQLFPSKPDLDVTDEMRAQNYTVEQMFRISEKFQVDLGMMPMVDSFWNLSMLTKPTDRDVVCYPSAWDFYTSPPDDTRIKMCTEVGMTDFITIHHEMGHVQNFLQYSSQPLVLFRSSANPGFSEAVGDVLTLSVTTPKHLSWLGLLKNNVEDEESDLNYQFATAMNKISHLPFLYLTDKYRFAVFAGNISTDNLNAGWWKYVTEYQGIVPPVTRSESDFDPAAKFHIDADVEYIRYFISYIMQFQFHKALCTAAGHTGPLYQCDINGSKAAGQRFSDMLSLGSSQPWPIALEKLTGTRNIDAGAILEFFDPLYKYLQAANTKNNEFIGWK